MGLAAFLCAKAADLARRPAEMRIAHIGSAPCIIGKSMLRAQTVGMLWGR
jgi:hypothetical protein